MTNKLGSRGLIISKDSTDEPFTINDVKVKMRNDEYFRNYFGEITEDLILKLIKEGKLKAKIEDGEYRISQDDFARFYDKMHQ